MEFVITNDSHPARADEIIDYLKGPRLWIPSTDYPDAEAWLQRAHGQINTGTKRAMVAYHQRRVAGVIIYQRDREDPTVLEVKNITVRPDVRGRHLAGFLLRNVEIEGQEDFSGVTSVRVDAKAGNSAIRKFLKEQRYKVIRELDLYSLGAGVDIIYSKGLRSHTRVQNRP